MKSIKGNSKSSGKGLVSMATGEKRKKSGNICFTIVLLNKFGPCKILFIQEICSQFTGEIFAGRKYKLIAPRIVAKSIRKKFLFSILRK